MPQEQKKRTGSRPSKVPERPQAAPRPKPPFHPYLILGVAVVLPGVGQVLNNQVNRGLLFLFTMIALGYVTYHLSTPEISWVGRYAGGLFIYALSLMDAYKWARVRWVIFHQPTTTAPSPAAAETSKEMSAGKKTGSTQS